MAFESPFRVLLVDDDIDIVDAVRDLLVAMGCEVTTATTLDGALAALQPSAPELLICDWRFGDADSESFLRHVQRAFPTVRRLLITGSPGEEWRALLATGVVHEA